jgi:eukaryotic-like serine/threonine-protein kinase
VETSAGWQRLREVFHSASEQPSGRREAFLLEVCAGDPDLLSEVRALLGTEDQGHDLIQDAVRDTASGFEEDALVGRAIGPWRVIRELGRGGMGRVLLAERADGEFEQRAALKVIRPGMDSAQILARFRRERQILARLQHPHIASLLDGGLTDHGHPWFAMEYVEGEPLHRYCDRNRLTVRQRLGLFLDVCEAVAYAHASLVIHRDLKPENILVNAEGQVRLLDFGLAKLLSDEDSPGARTETGLSVMTPAYAAPEQVLGEPVGTGTDVYALGVILYELLSGVRPYDVRTRSLLEIERVVCREMPERPSARVPGAAESPEAAQAAGASRGTDPRRLRKRLAGDLDVICLKALRKEPARRYASVLGLRDDIERHLTGHPVLARPDTTRYRLRKWAGRHRGGVAVGAAAAAGLVLLTTVYVAQVGAERDQARLEAAKAAEVAGFLQGLFELSDPSQSRGETVTVREVLDEGAARLDTELANQPEVRTTMMRVVGDVYGSLGLQAQGRAFLQQALAEQTALYGPEHPEVARTMMSLGMALQDDGEFEEAGRMFRESLALHRRFHGDRHPVVAEGLHHLSFLEETLGNVEVARDLMQEHLSVSLDIHHADDYRVAGARVKLAGLMRRTGELEAAEPLLRDGLEVQRRHYGEPHPTVASTMRNLAALLRDAGRFAEADTLFQEVIAMRRALFGDHHPDVANALNSHGVLLGRMGETDRATTVMREVLAYFEGVHPDRDHPSLAAIYHNLAEFLSGDEAVEAYLLAIAVSDRAYPSRHPNRAYSLRGLGARYLAQGDPVRAEPYLRQALELRREALRPGHRLTAQVLVDLGGALRAQGRLQEAEALLLEGVEGLTEEYGPDAGVTERARTLLIEVRGALAGEG